MFNIENFVQLGPLLFVLTVISICIGIKSKKDVYKHICYISAAVFFSLFVYETVILKDWNKAEVKIEWAYSSEDFNESCGDGKDPLLGYGPKKDGVLSVKKMADGKTLYDVKYTIKDGIRYTPNSNENSHEYKIFLGCSQIFGIGLNDKETFPYFYNELYKNKYNIKNYAYGGYGMHQALAIVENSILKDSKLSAHPENVHVFYNYYWYHIMRAAGSAFWDHVGPWYDIEDGTLIYKGSLADKKRIQDIKFFRIGWIYSQLWEQSNIYKKKFDLNSFGMRIDDCPQIDVKRTLLMIKKMNATLSQNGIKFFLIIDRNTSENRQCVNFFSENNISTICLECSIPDFWTNKGYVIASGVDYHATARLNKLKADILVKTLKTDIE